MSFVLDASVALTWGFPDEDSSKSIKLLERLETEFAFVPIIWALELSNAMLAAERKKRVDNSEIKEFFSLLENLNIKRDMQTGSQAFHEIFDLAQKEGLTTYDASYLELAARLNLPIATYNTQLIKAAKRIGIAVIK